MPNLFQSPLSGCYRRVAATADGERVLADLFDFGMLMASCHVPGDPVQTAYNEGMRRVALHVFSLAKMTPERAQLLADHNRKEPTYAAR